MPLGGGPGTLTTVDRRSGGDSGDGDETVPTPRGTTQVVTRGLLIIVSRGVSPRYEVLFQVAAGQSEHDTWHLAGVST
ncbi:hypothetical protein Tco_0049992, partial [Tanacetum coccineum]